MVSFRFTPTNYDYYRWAETIPHFGSVSRCFAQDCAGVRYFVAIDDFMRLGVIFQREFYMFSFLPFSLFPFICLLLINHYPTRNPSKSMHI